MVMLVCGDHAVLGIEFGSAGKYIGLGLPSNAQGKTFFFVCCWTRKLGIK